MAIVSLQEFADSLGMPYDTAKKNAQRGNIVRGTDGKIDTENPVNKVFFDKKKALISTKPVKEQSEKPTKKTVERVTGQTESQKQYLDLDLRTRIATAEAKEHESALKRMQLEKMAGNLLPVDLVENVLVINLQTIFKTFEGELENIASLFVTDRKELTEVMTKQKELLAKVIEKAKSDAMHEIDNAIDEYKEVRSRGERK